MHTYTNISPPLGEDKPPNDAFLAVLLPPALEVLPLDAVTLAREMASFRLSATKSRAVSLCRYSSADGLMPPFHLHAPGDKSALMVVCCGARSKLQRTSCCGAL